MNGLLPRSARSAGLTSEPLGSVVGDDARSQAGAAPTGQPGAGTTSRLHAPGTVRAGARILVLDADSNAGLAIVQSLGKAGHTCILGAVDERGPAFASRWACGSALYPDPMIRVDAFKAWASAWPIAHDVALIIPATERTLVPLHEMRDHVAVASLVAMPSQRSLETGLDKERVRTLAAAHGVPVPQSEFITSERELRNGQIDAWLEKGPVVVKTTKSKRWTGGSAHQFPTVLVRTHRELAVTVRERLPIVPVQVQAWVPGRGLGIQVLASHGEIVMSVAQERLHEVPLTGGASSYRRTIPMPPALLAEAQTLVRALEYHGVAMIEFRGDPDGPHWLMEINVRFWGSLPLAIFAGADFPRALVDMLLWNALPSDAAPRTHVYARHLERDLTWFKLVAKTRGRPSRYERTEPLVRSLVECGRAFSGREIWDGAALSDPGPIFREVRTVLTDQMRVVARKAREGVIQRLARRTSTRRARRSADVERVLFLCHGNICRSAYADHKMRQLDPVGRFGRPVSCRSQRDGRRTTFSTSPTDEVWISRNIARARSPTTTSSGQSSSC